MNKNFLNKCLGSICLLIAVMFSSCQNDFNEVIDDENVMNSDICSNLSRSSQNTNTSAIKVTVKEFREMMDSTYSQEELEFMMQLPDTLEISIYRNRSVQEFPKLNKQNIPVLRNMIRNQQLKYIDNKQDADSAIQLLPARIKSFSEGGGWNPGGGSGWNPGGGGSNPGGNDQIEYRSTKKDITFFRWIFQLEDSTWASSKVVATFNYIYNITKHKLQSVDKPICSIVNVTFGALDKYIFIWEDSGSKAEVANDNTKIIYTINGIVKCGVAFGPYNVGFTVENVDGITGQIEIS